MIRPALSFLFLALGFAACSLPSTDEYASGTSDAGTASSSSSSSGTSEPNEGGANEAGPEPVQDSGAEAGANVMANPGFEDGTCNANNFAASAYQSQGATPSSDAHTGMKACQACRANESTKFYSLERNGAVKAPVVGARYTATVWVKQGANSFKDQTAQLVFRTYVGQPFAIVEENEGTQLPLSNGWQMLSAAITPSKAAPWLDVYVAVTTLDTAGDRCVLLDDVTINVAP